MPNTRKRGNGEGSVYKLPNGKWRAAITVGWDVTVDAEGKKHKRRVVKTKSGFKYRRDAIAALQQMIQAPEARQNVTFKEMYDKWSASHFDKIAQDTVNGYKVAFKRCETLWYRQFDRLKTENLQKVVDDCQMSRRTKEDIKILLVLMYKYAIQNDYVDKNYAEFVKLPKKEKPMRDAFTEQEIDKLWKDHEAGNEFTGYILLMIYTGMRYGELAKLEKGNVKLSERYMIGGIKTTAGIDREIPIAECIYPIVEAFYHATDKKLLTMHEKVFYNSFHVTLDRLGIRPLNPHCCRHTFATLMAKANVAPAIITATAGHESYEMTLAYTHIHVDDRLKAVNAIYAPSSSSE